MVSSAPGEITALLASVRAGDARARARLFELTYDRMRAIAHGLMRRERPDHTLQPTALAHEVVGQMLMGLQLTQIADRHHFFAALTQAMRHVLIDHDRRHRAAKRGGLHLRQDVLSASGAADPRSPKNNVELLDAIEALAKVHERASQVVTLRFLAGFDHQRIAECLEVSLSTVESDWTLARAWLRRQLGDPYAGS